MVSAQKEMGNTMSDQPTESEVMGNGPPAAGHAGFGPPAAFIAHSPNNTELTFGTIGAWQAFLDAMIRYIGSNKSGLRLFFGRNEPVMDALEHQPQHRKAVGVIRQQFARAMGKE